MSKQSHIKTLISAIIANGIDGLDKLAKICKHHFNSVLLNWKISLYRSSVLVIADELE